MQTKFMQTKPEDFDKFPVETKQFWKSSFIKYPMTQVESLRSPFWFEYAESYIHYKLFTHKDFGVEKINEIKKMFSEGKAHTYFIQEAKKYLSAFAIEYYTVNYLIKEYNKKRYEKELIRLYDDFKIKYPSSKYIPYLEPMISEVIVFHKKVSQSLNDKIIFIENYKNKKTLKDVLKSLKGKKIYIDVWATWCMPCKQEFNHKEELAKLLKSKNIETLYISIDEDNRNKQWQDMIKFYNLEGHHIRANKELTTDLQRLFDNKGGIPIPWYLLIDEQGNIVRKHAKRPSQLQELEAEINSMSKN